MKLPTVLGLLAASTSFGAAVMVPSNAAGGGLPREFSRRSLVVSEVSNARPEWADPAGVSCQRPWGRPVEAAVVDPFRPPSDPFGPGNRGLEYATVSGDVVRAVADGVVRFAGPVAGAPVVVVDHGGLWSTYTSLAARLVARGQPVVRGQEVAQASEGFHLTARMDGHYLDPAELLDRRCRVVRLVPLPQP